MKCIHVSNDCNQRPQGAPCAPQEKCTSIKTSKLTVPKQQKLLQQTHQSQNGCGKGALRHPGFTRGRKVWPNQSHAQAGFQHCLVPRTLVLADLKRLVQPPCSRQENWFVSLRKFLNCESQACFLRGWSHRKHLSS